MATTIRAMLNTERVSKSGFYPLIIRVIHNRRKKLIYSDFRLRPEEFDPAAERVILCENSTCTKRRVAEMNRFIKTKKEEIWGLLYRLERENKDTFTADDIVVGIRRQTADRYLFHYIETEIEAKIKARQYGSADILNSSRNSLKRFVGSRNVRFSDITCRFINDYINHLRGRGISDNTIHMYLRNLRAVYNKAKKESVFTTKQTPFIDVKMNGTPTVKRAVTKETLRKIARLDLTTNKRLELVRDLFLFSFYTRGMSLVDILKLRHKNISDGNIYYVRNKTGQHFQVAIVAPLQVLIDKYRSDSSYIFPYIDERSEMSVYQQYRKALCVININLKRIGVMVGVEKPLTTYVARHSWATIAKSEGVAIAAISEGLGHTTEKTTQIYLRAFDHKMIDEVNAKVVVL